MIDTPFADGGDPIVLLPAKQPDIAAFHAATADRRQCLGRAAPRMRHHRPRVPPRPGHGGAGGGRQLLQDERLAPGTIAATYVGSVAVAVRGARPATLLDEYAFDAAFVAEYASAARTDAGFAAWCEQYVGTSMLAAAE